MQTLGFKILGDNHPICPVMLGDARLASQFADEMLKRRIYVIGFSYPVVCLLIKYLFSIRKLFYLGTKRSCTYSSTSIRCLFKS